MASRPIAVPQFKPQPKPAFEIATVSKIFLSCVSIECLGLIFVCIWSLFQHPSTYTRLNEIAVLGTSIALAVFAFHAVYTENKFQFLAFFALSVLLTARVIYGYFSPTSTRNETTATLFLAGLIVACVFQLIYSILGFLIEESVWNSFGYYAYKNISALPEDQAMYTKYQQLITFLYLDFSLAMVWMVLSFALLTTQAVIINSVAIAVMVLAAFVCWLAVIREQVSLLKWFVFLSLWWPAFVGYQGYNLYQNAVNEESTVIFNLVVAGASNMLMRVILWWGTHRVYLNFGKGLKAKAFDKHWPSLTNVDSSPSPSDGLYVDLDSR